jgi:hypothetical protein
VHFRIQCNLGWGKPKGAGIIVSVFYVFFDSSQELWRGAWAPTTHWWASGMETPRLCPPPSSHLLGAPCPAHFCRYLLGSFFTIHGGLDNRRWQNHYVAFCCTQMGSCRKLAFGQEERWSLFLGPIAWTFLCSWLICHHLPLTQLTTMQTGLYHPL